MIEQLKNKKKGKDKKGFTLAEVLITLTIIGVIAAILFPSILANYNERSLKAKRSAFVARMHQAMAELSDQFGTFADVTCTNPNSSTSCTDKDSALKFISEGLSKVYKIASICDKDTLDGCDIPDAITKYDGSSGSLYSMAQSFRFYTNGGAGSISGHYFDTPFAKFGVESGVHYKDLYPAAFITKNGESVLVFVNPECMPKASGTLGHEAHMCANMIVDLNGASGKPNKVGEDIWFLTSLYPNSPTVVAPKPFDYTKTIYSDATMSSGSDVISYKEVNALVNYNELLNICSSYGDNVVIPSFEEAISVSLNLILLGDMNHLTERVLATGRYPNLWSSTLCGPGAHWIIENDTGNYNGDNDASCNGDGYRNAMAFCVYSD